VNIDASDYDRFAAKLKGADRKVAAAIRKRLRQAAKPIGEHVREEGSDPMPARGGLRDRLRGSRVTTALRGSGVDIWVGNRRKSQLSPIDRRGVVSHPVYGNRKNWASQSVPEGTFSEAFQSVPPEARAEFEKVFRDVFKELGL
jgi:hypothetical protein